MILLINNFIFDIENFIFIEKPIITSLAEFLVYKRFFFKSMLLIILLKLVYLFKNIGEVTFFLLLILVLFYLKMEKPFFLFNFPTYSLHQNYCNFS